MNNEVTSDKQSAGSDIRTAKRNSGLFSFLKWFKNPGTSKESVNSSSSTSSLTSGSIESVNSTYSTGTVASFSFVPPDAYRNHVIEKCIAPGPETDTYRARLKQREKVREKDKNITLRKKYNLFFNRDTLLKPVVIEEDNSKSLPLMTKKTIDKESERLHRRTASESSKIRKAGAYCHVKGKRKAPQPPNKEDTFSLRRKKRTAPAPPTEKPHNHETMEHIDADVICNDSLKLDHGILKPAKEEQLQVDTSSSNSARSSYIEPPVSPRPWYKRNVATGVKKEKHELEKLPDLQYARNNTDLNLEETKIERKKEDKRKSGISFLANISELDREAAELLKKEKVVVVSEIPPFMRPKPEQMNTDSLVSPKRKSAKDLIAKFNAITNVTKVTVNAFQRDKREYFGGKIPKAQEVKKCTKKTQNEVLPNPLMKSESASVIKSKVEIKETPKLDRKSWYCPKCYLENEYWRIICHVCSTIKPYFDDLSTPPVKNLNTSEDKIGTKQVDGNKPQPKPIDIFERNLERSKTQIGFSALTRHNEQKDKKLEKSISVDEKTKDSSESKKEEREKLIKMLIEMKNSLPKKKINANRESKRTSIIEEGLEVLENESKIKETNANVNESKRKEIKELKVENVKTNSKKENDPVVGLIKAKEEIKKASTNAVIVLKAQNAAIKNTVFSKNEQESNVSVKTTKVNKEDAMNSVLLSKEELSQNQENERKTVINSQFPQNQQNGKKDNLNELKNKIKDNILHDKPIIVKEQMKENIFKSKAESSLLVGNQKAEENLGSRKEVLLVTQKTIYENISVNKNEPQKPGKVSTSAQTSAVVKKTPTVTGAIKKDGSFELMKPKDFAEIYNEKMGKPSEHLYANLGKENNDMSIFVNIPKKFSDLKNSVNITKMPNNTDTLEINRLLRRLETAIAKGELTDAAVFARELAQLKVNCSVIRQRENKSNQKKGMEFTVNMFVEDRLSHRGPFPIQVTADETVGELKKQVEKHFEIPINVQRWILGKELATDDKSTLKDHHVTTSGCAVFLYLVAPNKDSNISLDKAKEPEDEIKITSKPQEITEISNVKESNNKDFQAVQKIEINVQKIENLKVDKDLTKPSTSQQARNAKDSVQKTINISVTEKKLDEANMYRKSSTFEEDLDDYDCKTLRPQTKDWECRMCTLLNPPNSNICAVCATVHQKEQLLPKAVKRKAPQPKVKNETKALHLQLLDLDNGDLVANSEAFECMICLMEIGTGDGVILRECLHQFCKECLAYTVEFTDDAEIKCPYRDDQYSCDIALQDREIKALVAPNIYEQYLARSVAQVENKIEKSFHCKTPDCKGWCIFEDNVNEFRCPVCRKLNCLTCQAIHTGMNCKQYQEKMNVESEVDEDAKRTREMLEEMVNKGEALMCPACQVILMKKWGCDWVRCSMCKTEICWVTKGPRWGPGGKGDTSGGCKCGVNGVKCHAQCNYCH